MIAVIALLLLSPLLIHNEEPQVSNLHFFFDFLGFAWLLSNLFLILTLHLLQLSLLFSLFLLRWLTPLDLLFHLKLLSA